MASANVELVRCIFAAYERGDYSSAEWADPEIEFVVADGPDAGSWVGLAAMADAWRRRLSAWTDIRGTVDEYRELDDQRVLVFHRRGGRGKTSGLDLTQMQTEGAALYHVRDGKVKRLVVYWERERALADLGLPS